MNVRMCLLAETNTNRNILTEVPGDMTCRQQPSPSLPDHFELSLKAERRAHVINFNTDVGHVRRHGQLHTGCHPGCGVTVVAEVIPRAAVNDQPVVCETRPSEDEEGHGAVPAARHLQPARAGSVKARGAAPVSHVGQTDTHFCSLQHQRMLTTAQTAEHVFCGDAHVVLSLLLMLCCRVFDGQT